MDDHGRSVMLLFREGFHVARVPEFSPANGSEHQGRYPLAISQFVVENHHGETGQASVNWHFLYRYVGQRVYSMKWIGIP